MTTRSSGDKTALSERRTHSPFQRLQDQIDSVFDDFGRGFRWPEVFGSENLDVVPSMEVHHEDDKVTISAELPGVDEKEINLSVSERTLTISGEKKCESERKNGDGFRTERSYGSFSRSVTLPFEIDADKVEAKFDKGVLKVVVPKPAEVQKKTRKIEISH